MKLYNSLSSRWRSELTSQDTGGSLVLGAAPGLATSTHCSRKRNHLGSTANIFSSPNPPDVLDCINCSLFYAWIYVSTSNYIKMFVQVFHSFHKIIYSCIKKWYFNKNPSPFLSVPFNFLYLNINQFLYLSSCIKPSDYSTCCSPLLQKKISLDKSLKKNEKQI